MMTRITMIGWKRFQARKDRAVIRAWLAYVARYSEAAFRAGMRGPHSGQIARRQDGSTFRRSSGNPPRSEYPAVDSGALIASLRSRSNETEAVVGTSMYYSKWLREGTRYMARRKMSDDALITGANAGIPKSRRWVKWVRSR